MPDRFPPPWTLTDTGSCWRVEDANGFVIARFYHNDRQAKDTASEAMTRQQAYAMAKGFARLPELLGRK